MSANAVSSRRALLGALTGLGALAVTGGVTSVRAAPSRLSKPIPSTGEQIPAIGMGTWITFNVGDDPVLRAQRTEVLRAFFDAGGGLIDSSPMYGASPRVVGHALAALGRPAGLLSATKVWTSTVADGPAEIARSADWWGVETFDLLQVHNLLAWEGHLETLFAMKAAGRLRYVGVTTSHGRRHGELARIMERHPLDFVQLTYNAVDRAAEDRLLPLARERGIAVIANRPFRRGALVDRAQRRPLPAWAGELDCATWPAVLLKYIISHPAVTCAIPATSQVVHMRENMAAMTGVVPDAAQRRRIAAAVSDL
ncbi:aldo/keto reductase [Roseospira goensis]|uniref:Diketogulonate reductase-like aldo/keto reductase n=1 Tax=Roseospira goensis TaxID=391922 RepID=A0A7W6S3Q9_9PROT|nr:aldo/keto reductase [Roseospira goensis]MBB4287589.1 diketogulonate reductase-like aldo/keto reductase [Roseospira goensis]